MIDIEEKKRIEDDAKKALVKKVFRNFDKFMHMKFGDDYSTGWVSGIRSVLKYIRGECEFVTIADVDTLIEIPCDCCMHEGVCSICDECGVNNKWKMHKSIFNE